MVLITAIRIHLGSLLNEEPCDREIEFYKELISALSSNSTLIHPTSNIQKDKTSLKVNSDILILQADAIIEGLLNTRGT